MSTRKHNAQEFNTDKTDKYLRLFEEESGCKIGTIASTLQFLLPELKEKNWTKFRGNKDELTTFFEIYTVVRNIIMCTLESTEFTDGSKKPSKNSIKALTIKLLSKLPKSPETNKPILTKQEYMNNLHNLLNEISDELQDNNVQKENTESKPLTSDATIPVNIQRNRERETKRKKRTIHKKKNIKAKRKGKSNRNDTKLWHEPVRDLKNVWYKIPHKLKRNCCPRMCCMIILIGLCSWLIARGRELKSTKYKYENEATQEICSIIGWDKGDCGFSCDCDALYKYPEVTECGPSKNTDVCDSFQYTYSAIAREKCGDRELILNSWDSDKTCGNGHYEIGEQIDCYVLDCQDEEFGFTLLEDVGNGNNLVTIGAVTMVIGVCCCLTVCPWFCGVNI